MIFLDRTGTYQEPVARVWRLHGLIAGKAFFSMVKIYCRTYLIRGSVVSIGEG